MNQSINNILLQICESLEILIKKKKINQIEYILMKQFFIKKNRKLFFSILKVESIENKKDLLKDLLKNKLKIIKKSKEIEKNKNINKNTKSTSGDVFVYNFDVNDPEFLNLIKVNQKIQKMRENTFNNIEIILHKIPSDKDQKS